MHSERGQALSAFVAAVTLALVLMCGLVVDGSRHAAAARQAQSAAQGAARAGADALVTSEVAATGAARQHLALLGVSGDVRVADGSVDVTTEVSTTTVFLSVIGVTTLTGRGESAAQPVFQR